MADIMENKWAALVLTLVFTWCAWMSLNIVSMRSEMAALQLNQSNVIPPVVEASLRELREKTNSSAEADRSQLTRLTEGVLNNSKDIGYIRERLPLAIAPVK